jgi:hypothetical protein
MTRVFISYSRADEVFARRLATDLDRLGADVWIDVDDIPPGVNWSTAIQQGLDTCDALMLVISPDALTSKNVEDEWQYVRDEGKPIIPLLWRPVPRLHFQLRRIQYVDFHRQPYETALEQLRARLFDAAMPAPAAPVTGAITPVTARQIASLRELSAHRDTVRGVTFSPDGALLATCSDDKTVRLWHTGQRRRIRALIGHEKPVNAVAFSPDGTLLASASDDRTVRLWDVKRRFCMTALRGHTGRVIGLAWHPGGERLISWGEDSALRTWDVRARRQVAEMAGVSGFAGYSVAGSFATLHEGGGRVCLWMRAQERPLLDEALPAPAHCLALSPDGALLAVGFSEEGLLLIGASGQSLARVYYADYNANCVRGLAFSPDGALLAAASLDGGLRLWKTEVLATGGSTRAWRALHEHEGGLTAVTFSADGSLLATASHDGTARLWGVRG